MGGVQPAFLILLAHLPIENGQALQAWGLDIHA
jgi:hypothetical protein